MNEEPFKNGSHSSLVFEKFNDATRDKEVALPTQRCVTTGIPNLPMVVENQLHTMQVAQLGLRVCMSSAFENNRSKDHPTDLSFYIIQIPSPHENVASRGFPAHPTDNLHAHSTNLKTKRSTFTNSTNKQ